MIGHEIGCFYKSVVFVFQAGDGYLAGLAQKYSGDLPGLGPDEVLHQLEVMRRSEFKNQVRQKFSNKNSKRQSNSEDEESSYQEVIDSFGHLFATAAAAPQPQQQPYTLLGLHSSSGDSEESEVLQRLILQQQAYQQQQAYSPRHTYANFPSNTRQPGKSSYSPGTYAVSTLNPAVIGQLQMCLRQLSSLEPKLCVGAEKEECYCMHFSAGACTLKNTYLLVQK